MEAIDGEISDIEMHFPNGDCHCDVTVCREEDHRQCVEIFHHSGAVCRNCPGIVFSRYDLVPQFLKRTADGFVVKAYLPTNHQLSDLIDDLRTVSHHVRLLRIINLDGKDIGSQTADIDLSRLTNKQRETLERATERGYYKSPPSVSLAELAEEFGVSESALSQRLARAEEAVMGQLFSA
ncbi:MULTISPECIES: helix-turn-helix domain-containing protein [Haloferax]|nr:MULTISPECIES: helix-turn-helix domain-containing protein [Haloferax]